MEFNKLKRPGQNKEEGSTNLVSDSDNAPSRNGQFAFITRNGMIRVMETDNVHVNLIKKVFLKAVTNYGREANILAMHRHSKLGLTGEAQAQIFEMSMQGVAKKNGGQANLKYGFYGGSKDEIWDILSHGFSGCRRPLNSKFGHGVVLFPLNCCADCLPASTADDNGLRHMLLCRVILGNMEEIPAGSEQSQLSCVEFDSGVDNLSAPTKYIIWRPYLHSHILPSFIISFTVSRSSLCLRGIQADLKQMIKSVPLSFPDIINVLANYLDLSRMRLIAKHHNDFERGKITSAQMKQNLRNIVGDDLLIAAMKISVGKKLEKILDAKIRSPTELVPKRPMKCAAKNSFISKSRSTASNLMREIEKYLDPAKMFSINKVFTEYRKKKINGAQMMRSISAIAGHELVMRTAKEIKRKVSFPMSLQQRKFLASKEMNRA